MATFTDKYFSKFQCGFRKGYSTQQCLLALMEKWKSAVDSGKSFGALLMDLPKAFDCLCYQLLLAKLNAYGLSLSALRLISGYLFYRQQTLKINASYNSFVWSCTRIHFETLTFQNSHVWPVYYFRKLTLLVMHMTIHPLCLKQLLKTWVVTQKAVLLVSLNGFQIIKWRQTPTCHLVMNVNRPAAIKQLNTLY